MGSSDIALILQILQLHPWLGMLVVVTAVIAGGAWKAASTITERWFERRKGSQMERPSLRQHAFFAAVNHAIRSRVRGLDIPEPFRCKVFKDFLLVKFAVWLTETESLVAQVLDNEAMTQEAFRCAVTSYVDRMVERYEIQARTQGIPEQVVAQFALWHAPAIELVHLFLERVADSRWYPTCEDRLHAVLSFMTSEIDRTLVDAEDALAGINGHLDGIRYAGLISHCKFGDKCDVCSNPTRGLYAAERADHAPQHSEIQAVVL